MTAELSRWRIVPPIAWLEVCAARWIQWIDNAIAGFRGFTANQEQRLSLAVVDEAVTNSCAGGKCREVTCKHAMKFSIDPGIDLAFDDVDELLFIRLGMRP